MLKGALSLLIFGTGLPAYEARAQDATAVAFRCDLVANTGAEAGPDQVGVVLFLEGGGLSAIEVEGFGTAYWNQGQVGLGSVEAWAFFGLTGAGPVMSPDQTSIYVGAWTVKHYETMMALDRFSGAMYLHDQANLNWRYPMHRLYAEYRCQERRALF